MYGLKRRVRSLFVPGFRFVRRQIERRWIVQQEYYLQDFSSTRFSFDFKITSASAERLRQHGGKTG